MAVKTVDVTISVVQRIDVNNDNPTLTDAQAETEAKRLAEQSPAYQYITKSPHFGRAETTISAAVV